MKSRLPITILLWYPGANSPDRCCCELTHSTQCSLYRAYGTVLFNDVDDGAGGADKYLAHLSQAADCCRMKGSKQNKHL
eukprot:9246262-Ditylum_brightwellii.AAC.1